MGKYPSTKSSAKRTRAEAQMQERRLVRNKAEERKREINLKHSAHRLIERANCTKIMIQHPYAARCLIEVYIAPIETREQAIQRVLKNVETIRTNGIKIGGRKKIGKNKKQPIEDVHDVDLWGDVECEIESECE